jgi:hypothetical protein
MSTDCLLSSEESFTAEMQRLLQTASQSPWGPGREIDAKVHDLHQRLIGVHSRLGSANEQPDDKELAHEIDHELRNKLMIYHYLEHKRRTAATPRSRRTRTPNHLD